MRWWLVVGLCVAGCGSAAPRRAAPPAQPVVVLRRVIGEDPMVDQISVGPDRRVEVRRLRGGAGARFDHYRLTRAQMTRLRSAVARLGRRPAARPLRTDRWYYELWPGRQPPYQYVAGRVPPRARPALRLLRHLIDTSAQRDPAHT